MIDGNTLIRWGWTQGPEIGLGLALAKRLESQQEKDHVIRNTLDVVYQYPERFETAYIEAYADLAQYLIRKRSRPRLHDIPVPYRIYGADMIADNTIDQMNEAMRLPITRAGALMPDAHLGYGLPIGGVLATESDKVIPYAVGVDIACRMRLSIFDMFPETLGEHQERFVDALMKNTKFGFDSFHQKFPDIDPVLEEIRTHENRFVRDLYGKALQQIGSSGGGNHFVEFGSLFVGEDRAELLGLNPGAYVALMSHSGSRGFGFKIANYYTKIAKQRSKLPKSHEHLAWLDLNDQEGHDYWEAMQTAGRYAEANHHVIHQRVANHLGLQALTSVENHHNFAWPETLVTGEDVIVHRKGATPAGPGVLGIIPGSMADPGYIVVGKGSAAALNSASHGAGRNMSRSAAFRSDNEWDEIQRGLELRGITLIGGNLDESPFVYKNIDDVIAAQSELVDKVALFDPKIVRMAGD